MDLQGLPESLDPGAQFACGSRPGFESDSGKVWAPPLAAGAAADGAALVGAAAAGAGGLVPVARATLSRKRLAISLLVCTVPAMISEALTTPLS